MNKKEIGINEREELLQRLSRFKMVPGHSPDLNKLSNEELKKRANLMDLLTKRG